MELLTKYQIVKISKLIACDSTLQIIFKDLTHEKSFAQIDKGIIYYDYDGIIQNGITKLRGNTNLINYSLIQNIAHEIVHLEHGKLNKDLISRDKEIKTYEENIIKSNAFASHNSYGLEEGYNALIDEYYAEINGHLKTLEFLINYNPYRMTKNDFIEVNKYIAKNIMWYYTTDENSPRVPFNSYNKMIHDESKILTRIKRVVLGQISIKELKISRINYEKKYKLIRPNISHSYNSEFDKLFYGIDTSLISTIKSISTGKIETINIFEMLSKKYPKKNRIKC